MPQTCSVCRHDRREEIEQGLLAGEPYRTIAARTGVSTTALHRHRKQHIPAQLVNAKDAAAEVKAESLWERLQMIKRETAAIFGEARQAGNHVMALQAMARMERQLELEVRLLVQLSDAAKVALGINVTLDKPSPDLSKLFTEEELRLWESFLKRATADDPVR